MARIHPSAVVDSQASLADDVEVGAFSVIGPHVSVGQGSWIGPHVVINGHTTIGADNRIFQFASVGEVPQDKKYNGEPTQLVIGDRNTIREGCTLNRGTAQDGGITRLGSDNWIMAYVHVAHDCLIGDNCILANNATLAGHVHLGDWVFLGGFTTVHQFCHIGPHAMTAFTAAVSQDVPPYITAAGNRAIPHGINSEGLKRRGYTPEAILAIKRAYKTVYRNGLTLDEARVQLAEQAATNPDIQLFLDFIAQSTRGIIR